MIAALIGAAAGAGTMFALWRSGMLHERSGIAVLLAAIAFFYPVFAAQNGDAVGATVHFAIFAGFCAVAVAGFQRGAYIIAGGLIAHGVFDAGLIWLGAPGPQWWPAFCAGIDIVAGVILMRLIKTGNVPT
mgnify:CR=1 FL=1